MATRRYPIGRAFLLVALVFGVALPASAQLLTQGLSVATRVWTSSNSCANVDEPCFGLIWDPQLGPHEITLSQVFASEESVGRASFRPVWPTAWTLLGWETCSGTLVSGDPTVNGGDLTYTFAGCDQGPFLRYWFDCPSPGRFDARPFGLMGCSSGQLSVWYPLHVDIGDYCGAYSYGPCSQCGLPGGYSGTFTPATYTATLDPESVYIDTLQVAGSLGPWCYGLPECGGDHPGSGFVGINSDSPWMTVSLLPHGDAGWQTMSYRIHLSSALLPPGVYEGRVEAPAGCNAEPNCLPVTMVVRSETSATPQPVLGYPVVLGPPVPNPSSGTISFALHLEEAAPVRVVVADATGRLVGQVLNETMAAGTTWRSWNPSEAFRATLPSGVYFLRLESRAAHESRMFVFHK